MSSERITQIHYYGEITLTSFFFSILTMYISRLPYFHQLHVLSCTVLCCTFQSTAYSNVPQWDSSLAFCPLEELLTDLSAVQFKPVSCDAISSQHIMLVRITEYTALFPNSMEFISLECYWLLLTLNAGSFSSPLTLIYSLFTHWF